MKVSKSNGLQEDEWKSITNIQTLHLDNKQQAPSFTLFTSLYGSPFIEVVNIAHAGVK